MKMRCIKSQKMYTKYSFLKKIVVEGLRSFLPLEVASVVLTLTSWSRVVTSLSGYPHGESSSIQLMEPRFSTLSVQRTYTSFKIQYAVK